MKTENRAKSAEKTNLLTASEARLIIKTCQASGVELLSFRGLRIRFSDSQPGWKARKSFRTSEADLTSAAQIEEDDLLKQEMDAKEQQIAELLITDPFQHEQLVGTGELIDGGESSLEEEGHI
jgi:hypothetical protein